MSKLIVITGATSTGKTQVALEVAKKINGEIISADSMQIYRKMDIGTAKPSIEERQGIPHYLMDEEEPSEYFSVARYKQRADVCIKLIQYKNKIPILVGGTGFYINAVLYGNDFTQTNDDMSVRNYYYTLAEKKGKEYVYNLLVEIDNDYAKQVHFNNLKRVVRALEYYEKTGELFSVHNKRERSRVMLYDAEIFVLSIPRDLLYKRLDDRVDKMITDGLVDEVHSLLKSGVNPQAIAMNGIGYKELIPYINGDSELGFCIELIKKNTRHYAKRQNTWFKNQLNGIWIDVSEFQYNLDKISERLINNVMNNK